ncbi:MAG: universal stress protein [Spirochaetales bacterium]|nr:universal stress protein [Spirochaetales bacterium]
MEMYKKILVTVDCSDVDMVIVEHIGELAKIHHSEVFLYHVVHSHTLEENRVLYEKAQKHLSELEKYFKEREIPVNTIIRSGEPEKVVLKDLDEGDYDLVAMATHGHKMFLDLVLGSLSERIKHHSNIPLLLIKAR